MKWLVAIALVIASASIVLPALARQNGVAVPDRLDQIHELASF